MSRQILYFALLVVAAGILISALAASAYRPQISPVTEINNNGDLNDCYPTYVDSAASPVKVRQPAQDLLPSGYSLKAVRTGPDTVTLYYSGKSLCPFPRGGVGWLPSSTISIMITPVIGVESGEEYADDRIASFRGSVAGIQELNVGSNKGYGWESFVDRHSPAGSDIFADRVPSRLGFYYEQDNTEYVITGLQPLPELKEIAESIQ